MEPQESLSRPYELLSRPRPPQSPPMQPAGNSFVPSSRQHTTPMFPTGSTKSSLVTLPAELRRLIVSFLAPARLQDLRPGCKDDLRNANLAHSCLRQWVPEYMFRDMVLEHLIVGMSPHLEQFALHKGNTSLLKHVKAIQVKVPPAIRWDLNASVHFDSLEDDSARRLCRYLKADGIEKMTPDQQKFCNSYHRALVEPFTSNRRWYSLLRNAQNTWQDLFRFFPNLEEIGVGCCEIDEHPAPTSTKAFLTRYGSAIRKEVWPPYIEDSTVNIGWASAIVLEAAPPTVQRLHLGMVNLDHFNFFSTVNRLLGIVYQRHHFLSDHPPLNITKLCINFQGLEGMHGSFDWDDDMGSAISVRYWVLVLSSLRSLVYLEFGQERSYEHLAFTLATNEYEIDLKSSPILHLLQNYRPERLKTLRLAGFLFQLDQCLQCLESLARHWASPTDIIFDYIHINTDTRVSDERGDAHIAGSSWVALCRILKKEHPGLQISLIRPRSHLDNEEVHHLPSSCLRVLQNMGVHIEDGNREPEWRGPLHLLNAGRWDSLEDS